MTRLALVLALSFTACAPLSAAPARTTEALQTPTPTLFITTTAPTASPAPDPSVFRYVALGASDTVGVGASDPRSGSWPARVAARLPVGVGYVNLGVSGSLAAQAASEQLPRAIELRPRLVTIWLAVNDLNASVASADYAAALQTIVGPLIARTDARIFIGNVPDLRSVPAYAGTDPAALLARISAYNTAIASVAATAPTRVTVVDLFAGSAALMSQVTVSPDGFHPSDGGYALIAQRFGAALAAAGIPLR